PRWLFPIRYSLFRYSLLVPALRSECALEPAHRSDRRVEGFGFAGKRPVAEINDDSLAAGPLVRRPDEEGRALEGEIDVAFVRRLGLHQAHRLLERGHAPVGEPGVFRGLELVDIGRGLGSRHLMVRPALLPHERGRPVADDHGAAYCLRHIMMLDALAAG